MNSTAIRLDRNPLLQPGLDALSFWLEQNHYSQHAREAVLAHAAREGTPTGSAYLDDADEAGAEAAFVDNLPAIDPASDAWDRDTSVIFLPDLLITGHPFPIPVTGDDDRTEPDGDLDRTLPAVGLIPPVLEDLAAALPPIAGGAPDDDEPPFEPGPDDLADYGRWSEDLDRRREMLAWYGRNPIAAFNADRPD